MSRGDEYIFTLKNAVDNCATTKEELAKFLKISKAALNSYLYEGRTNISAPEIKKLFEKTNDLNLITYFLEDTNFDIFLREDIANPCHSITDQAVKVSLESADVLRATADALSDDKLCHQDKRIVFEQITEAERALASLKSILT